MSDEVVNFGGQTHGGFSTTAYGKGEMCEILITFRRSPYSLTPEEVENIASQLTGSSIAIADVKAEDAKVTFRSTSGPATETLAFWVVSKVAPIIFNSRR